MVFYDAGLNDTAFQCSPSYKPKTKEGEASEEMANIRVYLHGI